MDEDGRLSASSLRTSTSVGSEVDVDGVGFEVDVDDILCVALLKNFLM